MVDRSKERVPEICLAAITELRINCVLDITSEKSFPVDKAERKYEWREKGPWRKRKEGEGEERGGVEYAIGIEEGGKGRGKRKRAYRSSIQCKKRKKGTSLPIWNTRTNEARAKISRQLFRQFLEEEPPPKRFRSKPLLVPSIIFVGLLMTISYFHPSRIFP
jgi:hypothetical protein